VRYRHLRGVLTLSAATLLAAALPAHAEVVQKRNVRVNFEGSLTPKALPRSGTAPVRVSVGADITALGKSEHPPRLRTLTIAINKYGRFDPNVVPKCQLQEIQPASTENALAACGASLIGKGTFQAKVLLGKQAPFPSSGTLYAFNGVVDGRPAILAHVYGENPVPTSFTLVFKMQQRSGTYGTVLSASLPEATGSSGYITELSLDLGKQVRSHGKTSSYLSASCPAPAGFPGADFPFAKAGLSFGSFAVDAVVTRSCKALGR
jgi:hypothetical protein